MIKVQQFLLPVKIASSSFPEPAEKERDREVRMKDFGAIYNDRRLNICANQNFVKYMYLKYGRVGKLNCIGYYSEYI